MDDIAGVDVVIQGFFDEFLRFISGQLGNLRVEKDQLKVKAGSEHEHVIVEPDFGDRAAGQGVADSHHSYALIVVIDKR